MVARAVRPEVLQDTSQGGGWHGYLETIIAKRDLYLVSFVRTQVSDNYLPSNHLLHFRHGMIEVLQRPLHK